MSFFGRALAGPARLALQSAHGPSGRDGLGGLPPSPPAENATTRQDQAGQSCTGDGAGSWKWGIGRDDAREVAGRRIVVVEKCGVAAVADVRSVHNAGLTSKPQYGPQALAPSILYWVPGAPRKWLALNNG